MLRGLGCHEDTELSLLLTDNEGIRALNRRYLDRDRPTDVLSFP
ncbi:MAG: rRNA maturation RNase YbeY, partial [Deltaproteobacteria bacterium]